jgi:ABC-type Zn uptake system ZnuABC Zn-binding protein ZnuA
MTEDANLVARNTGGKVVLLVTSVGANDKVDNYFDLFNYNIDQIASALR